MYCVNHTNTQAAGVCVSCGKFFCDDCLVEADGKNYCKSCIGKAFSEQEKLSKSPQTININNNNIANSVSSVNQINSVNQMISPKSRLVSLLLCIFLGFFGIHRFYAGKIGTGIIYILTLGLFGFGVLFDFILIIIGSFRDKYGMFIKNW
nr:NINE protein [uncultured Lachnoclostridium sp.]